MQGLLASIRFRGQEGAAADAPLFAHLGSLGVIGFLMKDLGVNSLDYVEGGKYDARRVEISQYLDSTNPDLTPFFKHGGKLIVTIGSGDTTASPGSQLDYFQSVIVRAVLRHSRGRPRPERLQLLHRWKWQEGRGKGDSAPDRFVRTAARLGRR